MFKELETAEGKILNINYENYDCRLLGEMKRSVFFPFFFFSMCFSVHSGEMRAPVAITT